MIGNYCVSITPSIAYAVINRASISWRRKLMLKLNTILRSDLLIETSRPKKEASYGALRSSLHQCNCEGR
jgi:hypothetical protein